MEAKTAKHLASIGYVRVVEEKKAEKSEDKPAETTKSKRGK
ncbi:hypothetical protein [Brevibacillus reuszeri]|nr:hypothetical protein [Brevibacillus reuszeri]